MTARPPPPSTTCLSPDDAMAKLEALFTADPEAVAVLRWASDEAVSPAMSPNEFLRWLKEFQRTCSPPP